jgi:hypothetical protein
MADPRAAALLSRDARNAHNSRDDGGDILMYSDSSNAHNNHINRNSHNNHDSRNSHNNHNNYNSHSSRLHNGSQFNADARNAHSSRSHNADNRNAHPADLELTRMAHGNRTTTDRNLSEPLQKTRGGDSAATEKNIEHSRYLPEAHSQENSQSRFSRRPDPSFRLNDNSQHSSCAGSSSTFDSQGNSQFPTSSSSQSSSIFNTHTEKVIRLEGIGREMEPIFGNKIPNSNSKRSIVSLSNSGAQRRRIEGNTSNASRSRAGSNGRVGSNAGSNASRSRISSNSSPSTNEYWGS